MLKCVGVSCDCDILPHLYTAWLIVPSLAARARAPLAVARLYMPLTLMTVQYLSLN